MAFKEGVDVAHVHAFRALRTLVAKLDEDIDAEGITPHQAVGKLVKAIDEFPPEAKKGKKDA